MNVTLRVEQDVVGLEVTVDDPLGMDVPQGTTQLRDPEAHGFLGEAFPGDVESQITTIH